MKTNHRSTPAPDLPDLSALPERNPDDLDFLIEVEKEYIRRRDWHRQAEEYLDAKRRDDIAYHNYSIARSRQSMANKAADRRMERSLRDSENQWRREHGYPLLPPRKK